MPELEPRNGTRAFESGQPKFDQLTPSQAINRLLMIHPHHPQVDDDRDIQDRFQRGRKVFKRLLALGTFLQGIEGRQPSSLGEAFDRHATLIGLLVHPTVEEVITENLTTLHLPESAFISIVGSTGNGVAQVRTLAGTDDGFDHHRTRPGKPDIDAYLISEAPLPVDKTVEYNDNLRRLLDRYNIRLDSTYNLAKYNKSVAGAEIDIWGQRPGSSLHNLRWILPIFYPGFPETTASQLRWEVVSKLVNLGEINSQRHQQVIEKLKADHRELAFPLSSRYFESQMQDDVLEAVRITLGTRIVGVFDDLMDITRTQDSSVTKA